MRFTRNAQQLSDFVCRPTLNRITSADLAYIYTHISVRIEGPEDWLVMLNLEPIHQWWDPLYPYRPINPSSSLNHANISLILTDVCFGLYAQLYTGLCAGKKKRGEKANYDFDFKKIGQTLSIVSYRLIISGYRLLSCSTVFWPDREKT